jgi:PEP-CTERM motif
MNIQSILKSTAVAAALVASFGTVQAATCTAGDLGSLGTTTDNVTYGVNGPVPTTTSATSCFAVQSGNINEGGAGPSNYGTADINNLLGIGGADFVGSVTSGTSSAITLFGTPITFTLSAVSGTSGTYTLSATGANLFPPSIFLDFAVGLKASDRFGLWFFNDALFDGSGGGSWTITFAGAGGPIPNISHIELYIREGSSDTTSQTTSITVVEPGSSSLALLGLGLLGAGFVARRKTLGR